MGRRLTIAASALGIGASAAALATRPRLRRILRRWLAVTALAARTGFRGLVHRLRRLLVAPERRRELEVAFQIRSTEDVVATLGEMKGTFMKVGQLLSYLDDAMPEHIRAVLSQLQDSIPPMAPQLVAEVVTHELGAPPERLFRSWQPTPIAAASIGQVHRAVLHDGTVVAVKVQYPGVGELMEADLAQLDLGRLVAPAIWPSLDVAGVTAELKARLREELDYTIEATNQRDFARWYAGHPFIRIPRVIDQLSTRRVLTMAFADGDRFAQFERREQEERDLAAEAIFRFVFRSLHDFHAFNGDPHPGNYLFGDGGVVSFVDFGLVKRLPADVHHSLHEAVRYAALDPDPVELRRVLEEVGHFPPGSPLTDQEIFEFSAVVWSYMAEDRPTTLTPAWASETVRWFLFKPGFKQIDRWGSVPADLVILQRITVGLLAILGRLNATANWHRIARELWLGEPPASLLGEREAEWKVAAAS